MLEVKNLSKTFGETKALSDVSLKVGRGEMVALIGASGSGKSTLLRHVPGLLTSDKGAGHVAVAGRKIQSDGVLARDARRVRRDVGLVFQQFNLVGRLTVLTNVLLGALGRTALWRAAVSSFSPEDRRLALESLSKVGILDKSGQRASTLSGGQQQRAAIARALVQKASVILADEPIASLDPESSILVMETLSKLNREEGLTVLVSLHQIDYAVLYCPRVVALCCGRVLYDGPGGNLDAEKIQSVYGRCAAGMFGGLNEREAAPAVRLSAPPSGAGLDRGVLNA
ncbi:MAG: phosphonate ABC transporter ATP-binding protein [Deltaproteobacteria bacterium]|jgi:phosphonate transport system ATP-binding protein|nr:phosphonate ABC transporter ATP-binding protein [Deltaproteobacteria bacterium]